MESATEFKYLKRLPSSSRLRVEGKSYSLALFSRTSYEVLTSLRAVFHIQTLVDSS
jgi:hypothetical protein